ncbi:hypothetical protein Tsubulata_039336 [Turnera subulata]|uniref:Uncharacterized protein n=1 Tax=Turnera subulata TaxID=218843 RepID=A0A9Q0FH46_9ROSI|nr:hypothetical protein Tsubulata_039336 [Turnera subulata]
MAAALETLCGQAFGAGQYRKLGNQTYGAIFFLTIVSIGLSSVPSVVVIRDCNIIVRPFTKPTTRDLSPVCLPSNHVINSLTIISTLYSIPYGLSAAVSTRVSNELGSRNPQAGRVAVYSVMILAVTELLAVSGALFTSGRVFGYIFSGDKEVVDYVSTVAPLICLSVIVDGSQGVQSGVAKGCGWQKLGAYVNIASLYLGGIPAAAILGFWQLRQGKGSLKGDLGQKMY